MEKPISSVPPDASRALALDVLRVIAITLVLARHSIRPYWSDFSHPFLPVGPFDFGPMLLNGWIGVDLFFVLSGFLITQQLIPVFAAAKEARAGKILYYLKKRFFRIAPAYYLILTLACLGFFPGYPEVNAAAHSLATRYIYHLFFLNDYFPSDIVVVFWSLAVEMKFYLCAPFLVLLLMGRNARTKYTALGGLLLLMIVLRWVTAVYIHPEIADYTSYFTLMRNKFHLTLDGLLGGMVCAMLWNEGNIRAILRKPKISFALSGAGILLLLVLIMPGPLLDNDVSLFDKVFLPSCLALGFSMMLMGTLGRCGHIISQGSPITLMALLSYSIYLIHMPLMKFASAFALTVFGSATPQIQWLATLLPLLVISLGGSALIYFVVERPFNRWAKKR